MKLSWPLHLRGKLDISPRGSQIIPSLLCVGGMLIVVSPLLVCSVDDSVVTKIGISVVGLICVLLSCWMWDKSHVNVDRSELPAVTIATHDGDRGATVAVPSQELRSPEAIDTLGRLVSSLQYRQPLPDANGIVDQGGKPIPDSEQQAVALTKELNEELRELRQAFLSHYNEENERSRIDRLKEIVAKQTEQDDGQELD